MAVLNNTGILMGASAVTDGAEAAYEINKSLRFHAGDSTVLTRTLSAGNQRTGTISFWLKKGKMNEQERIITFMTTESTAYLDVQWGTDNGIIVTDYPYGGGSNVFYYSVNSTTGRRIHDGSAWVHVCIAWDSNQDAIDDRVKVWINGRWCEPNEWGYYDKMSNQYAETEAYRNNTVLRIGNWNSSAGNSFDGYLADVYILDGCYLTPSFFAKYNSNNMWVPKALGHSAPNNGTTWSSSLTSSNGFYSGAGANEAFDAPLSTNAASANKNQSLTFTPPGDGIPYTHNIEVYCTGQGDGNVKVRANDTYWVNMDDSVWTVVAEGQGNLTKLEAVGNSNGHAVFNSIKVDGQRLFDGQTDYTTPDNINANTTWSDSMTGSANSGAPVTRIFNGKSASGSGQHSFANDGNNISFVPSSTITAGLIEVHIECHGSVTGANDFKVNNTSKFNDAKAFLGDETAGWYPIGTTIDSTNGLYFGREDTNNKVFIHAIRVDGHMLVDSTVDNSCHLKFEDTSTIGKDSLNSNDLSASNFTATSGSYKERIDLLPDTPTNIVPDGGDTGAGGELTGNYCVLNPSTAHSPTTGDMVEGNLGRKTNGSSTWCMVSGSIAVNSGKWYWEVKKNNNQYCSIGFKDIETKQQPGDWLTERAGLWAFYPFNGKIYDGTNNTGGTDHFSADSGSGNWYGVALDMDAGKAWIRYNNGNWVGDPSQGTGAGFTDLKTGGPSGWITPMYNIYSDNGIDYHNFGQYPFKNTAPSGFKCLHTANMPEPAIADASTAVHTQKYDGVDSGNIDIQGMNFGPDLVLVKRRNNSQTSDRWVWVDVIRGIGTALYTDGTDTPAGDSSFGKAFHSDGFRMGNHSYTGTNGGTYGSWAWDAGTAAITPSSSYNITPSAQWVNEDAGFSMTKYTGNGSDNQTIPHALGAVPDVCIVKNISSSINWIVKHRGLSSDKILYLDNNGGEDGATGSNHGNPDNLTSNVTINLTTNSSNFNNTNKSGDDYMMYCWTSKHGFSRFGSYVGNGSSWGPFCWTGFRPKIVLYKRFDDTGYWNIRDDSRSPFSNRTEELYPAVADQENTHNSDRELDFQSNGFQIRSSSGAINNNNGKFIYFAWAANPFASNNRAH